MKMNENENVTDLMTTHSSQELQPDLNLSVRQEQLHRSTKAAQDAVSLGCDETCYCMEN